MHDESIGLAVYDLLRYLSSQHTETVRLFYSTYRTVCNMFAVPVLDEIYTKPRPDNLPPEVERLLPKQTSKQPQLMFVVVNRQQMIEYLKETYNFVERENLPKVIKEAYKADGS